MLWARFCSARRSLAIVAAVAVCALGSPVWADEPALQYEVRILGLKDAGPGEELLPVLERTLRSFRLKSQGAPSLALLRRRAESDLSTIDKIMRAEGYYAAKSALSLKPPGKGASAQAVFSVTPGRPYTLSVHRFLGASRMKLDAAALGSPIGERARAAKILAAEAAALETLKRSGRPFAKLGERRVEKDDARATLQVVSTIDLGPAAKFGALTVDGAVGVDRQYIDSYKTWTEGDAFDEKALAEFERALAATGLFEVALVRRPTPGDLRRDGSAPIALEAREAPARSASIGARYSTDGGAEGRVSFEHRNIAGAGEKLTATLEGGAEDQAMRLEMRKPQYRRKGQEVVAALSLRREQSDAFDETAADLALGLERGVDFIPGARARAGLGLLFELSIVEDASAAQGGAADETAYLLGAPFFLRVDARDDPLSPTEGYRLNVSTTPFIGAFDGGATELLTLDLQGAAYVALDHAAEFVLASRGRIGLIISEDLASVPAPRRLYSGGGGSVRGYAQRFAGPLDASGDPIGGRLALELGGELRWRAFEEFGAVAFIDAGAVATDPGFEFGDDLRFGAGPGLRYYSPIGPVGIDVGLPIAPRPQDAPYQLYFFIGQAF